MIPRLKELYKKEIQQSLKSQFGYKNVFMGPEIEKIVINMGLGLDGNDAKIMKSCEEDREHTGICEIVASPPLGPLPYPLGVGCPAVIDLSRFVSDGFRACWS